mmetsp:Transcript_26552/g.55708  ORF Transcript_26552/g.55708 Transcript_26552/m.55708 type:complete len:502 (+) Transcript_26552:872-2377(+)
MDRGAGSTPAPSQTPPPRQHADPRALHRRRCRCRGYRPPRDGRPGPHRRIHAGIHGSRIPQRTRTNGLPGHRLRRQRPNGPFPLPRGRRRARRQGPQGTNQRLLQRLRTHPDQSRVAARHRSHPHEPNPPLQTRRNRAHPLPGGHGHRLQGRARGPHDAHGQQHGSPPHGRVRGSQGRQQSQQLQEQPPAARSDAAPGISQEGIRLLFQLPGSHLRQGHQNLCLFLRRGPGRGNHLPHRSGQPGSGCLHGRLCGIHEGQGSKRLCQHTRPNLHRRRSRRDRRPTQTPAGRHGRLRTVLSSAGALLRRGNPILLPGNEPAPQRLRPRRLPGRHQRPGRLRRILRGGIHLRNHAPRHPTNRHHHQHPHRIQEQKQRREPPPKIVLLCLQDRRRGGPLDDTVLRGGRIQQEILRRAQKRTKRGLWLQRRPIRTGSHVRGRKRLPGKHHGFPPRSGGRRRRVGRPAQHRRRIHPVGPATRIDRGRHHQSHQGHPGRHQRGLHLVR